MSAASWRRVGYEAVEQQGCLWRIALLSLVSLATITTTIYEVKDPTYQHQFPTAWHPAAPSCALLSARSCATATPLVSSLEHAAWPSSVRRRETQHDQVEVHADPSSEEGGDYSCPNRGFCEHAKALAPLQVPPAERTHDGGSPSAHAIVSRHCARPGSGQPRWAIGRSRARCEGY